MKAEHKFTQDQKYGRGWLEKWMLDNAKECPMCESRLLYVIRDSYTDGTPLETYVCACCSYSFTQV